MRKLLPWNLAEVSGRDYRNLSSHIDMHTDAGSTLHNPLALTFDLLISGSLHVQVLP